MCQPAPVALSWYANMERIFGSKVHFLGIVGDQAHAVRSSGHNCGAMAELSCTDSRYAHACDTGVDSTLTGLQIVRLALKEPDVHYALFQGVGYYPDHRGGGRFDSFDHEGHVHVSFGCGSTFHRISIDSAGDELVGAREDILNAISSKTFALAIALRELDEDLPEKRLMQALQTRVARTDEKVTGLETKLVRVEALVEDIATKLGVPLP